MSSTRRDLFHWVDYLLFTLSLASTLIVGIVIAIKDRWTSESSEDYLMAGRKMNWSVSTRNVYSYIYIFVLTLLDLSAAFDTIDYSVLINRLSDWYDISGTALTWIRSFLINRFQSIQIRNCFSNAVPFFCGVPQCSVLGPLLFTLYTTPLSTVIHIHKLDHHLYPDDTQVYISLSTADTELSLKNLVTVSVISLAG